MRVLVTGGFERATRLQPVLEEAGWDVLHAANLGEVEKLADGGDLTGLDAAVLLPAEIAAFETETESERLLEFLDKGLLTRIRNLSTITAAVRPRGGCRFVLVGGNVPPARIPDNQAARANLLAAAGRAAVADGGPGCTAKVLGPTATDRDILAALTPTGKTPMVVWDLPSGEQHLSFVGWRDAILADTGL